MREWNIDYNKQKLHLILFLCVVIVLLLGALGFTIGELLALRNDYLSMIEKCADCLEFK